MNIDDMRVGDFLYLIDTLQEECVSKRKCIMCKYHDICDNNDICSISTPNLKKAVEAYAEMNGMLEHMHYVNDQKWIPVSERLPDKYGTYLVQFDYGEIRVLDYVDGWNCTRDYLSGEIYREYEIHSVVAWMTLPKEYEGETANVD